MSENILIEPDLKFIAEITEDGGDSLKKCFQCATCSVACSLSHEQNPFPRKEMIYASWGLKDRLTGNPDIWLCHNCGDCSSLCPRDAKPGDVLNAIRKSAIREYAKPEIMNRLLNNPKMLPLFFILPAIFILFLGTITGMIHFNPEGEKIVFAHFFPVTFIESIYLPLSTFSAAVLFIGVKKLLKDMQNHYLLHGKTINTKFNVFDFIKTLISIFPSILKHENFSTCSENKSRKISHMLVSFSFIGLAFVAGAFVFAIYVLDSHGPYTQINPIKIFANIAGIALIAGSILLIKDRVVQSTQKSDYYDWYLLGLALVLGVSGITTQLLRLFDLPTAAYSVYFIHLVFVFNLILFLPYSKLAHLVYRTVAIAYNEYIQRN